MPEKTPAEAVADILAAKQAHFSSLGAPAGLTTARNAIQELQTDQAASFYAAVECLMQGTAEEKQAAFWLANLDFITIPDRLLREGLRSDDPGLIGTSVNHCGTKMRHDFAPDLIQVLEKHHSSHFIVNDLVRAMLDLGCPEFHIPLRTYCSDILRWSGHRPRYFGLLEQWGIGIPRRPIRPFPAETWGQAMPGTTPPAEDIVPCCPSCHRPMILLLRTPPEVECLDWPVYHCLHCIFHSPIYLQHLGGSFRWLGESGNWDDLEDSAMPDNGGHIVWGIDPGPAVDTPPPAGERHCGRQESLIGGIPEWVQYGGEFICPGCAREMQFLLQLRSDYSFATRFYFYWGGMMYVFRCIPCSVTGYYFECS